MEIKEQYEKHIVPDEIKEDVPDPYSLVLNIEDVVKKLEKEQSRYIRHRIKNHIAQKFCMHTLDILKAEDKVFVEMIEWINEVVGWLIEITSSITEENYIELTKLVDFLVAQFEQNKSYYASRMKAVEEAQRGFGYFDGRCQNTRKEVKAFMEEKISSMKGEKHLEKTEKI